MICKIQFVIVNDTFYPFLIRVDDEYKNKHFSYVEVIDPFAYDNFKTITFSKFTSDKEAHLVPSEFYGSLEFPDKKYQNHNNIIRFSYRPIGLIATNNSKCPNTEALKLIDNEYMKSQAIDKKGNMIVSNVFSFMPFSIGNSSGDVEWDFVKEVAMVDLYSLSKEKWTHHSIFKNENVCIATKNPLTFSSKNYISGNFPNLKGKDSNMDKELANYIHTTLYPVDFLSFKYDSRKYSSQHPRNNELKFSIYRPFRMIDPNNLPKGLTIERYREIHKFCLSKIEPDEINNCWISWEDDYIY